MGASPPVIHNMKKNLMAIWLQEKKKLFCCVTLQGEKKTKKQNIFIYSAESPLSESLTTFGKS